MEDSESRIEVGGQRSEIRRVLRSILRSKTAKDESSKSEGERRTCPSKLIERRRNGF